MAAPGMVEIPFEDYDKLMERSVFLGVLEAAGVDNWEGYDGARERYEIESASLSDGLDD